MGGTKQPFMVALMGGGVCKRLGGGERGGGVANNFLVQYTCIGEQKQEACIGLQDHLHSIRTSSKKLCFLF